MSDDIAFEVRRAAGRFNAYSQEMARLQAVEERLKEELERVEKNIAICSKTSGMSACESYSDAWEVLQDELVKMKMYHYKLTVILGCTKKYTNKGEVA